MDASGRRKVYGGACGRYGCGHSGAGDCWGVDDSCHSAESRTLLVIDLIRAQGQYFGIGRTCVVWDRLRITRRIRMMDTSMLYTYRLGLDRICFGNDTSAAINSRQYTHNAKHPLQLRFSRCLRKLRTRIVSAYTTSSCLPPSSQPR